MKKLGKGQIVHEKVKQKGGKRRKWNKVIIGAFALVSGCIVTACGSTSETVTKNTAITSTPEVTKEVLSKEEKTVEVTEKVKEQETALPTEKVDEKDAGSVEATTQPTAQPTAEVSEVSKAWKKAYKDDKKYYVSSDYLKENAAYYMGNVVITVVEVGKVKDEYFKVTSGLITSYEVNMAETTDLETLSKGDKVAVIGKVKEISDFVEAVTISDAYILKVSDVSEYTKKIEDKKNEQKSYVKKQKKAEKKAAAKAEKAKIDKYKKDCVWPDYEQVQRKPKKYKGKKSYIVGEAIQVSEGYFDTVTLRVNDGDGNMWLVSYSYQEDDDRILEGDYIQIWGDCTGTTTYTTILGDTVTIPSIDAKYIEPSYS